MKRSNYNPAKIKRRQFIKISSGILATIINYNPLFGLGKLNYHEYYNYPFINDFPESKKIFKLSKSLISPKNNITVKSIQKDFTSLNKRGKIIFNGNEFESFLILDLGKEYVGHYNLSATSTNPCDAKVTYGESLYEVIHGFNGIRNNRRISWYENPEDNFTITKKDILHKPTGRRACRYIKIETDGHVILQNFNFIHEHYPVTNSGHFQCSDKELNKLWEIGRYTTKLCMQQFYEDGIKRDGLLWISDYRIQFLCNAYCFGDHELAKKSLYIIAASQRKDGAIPACAAFGGGHRHPDDIDYMPGVPFENGIAEWILINYSADFISCIKDYISYTYDTSVLKRLLPTVKRLIAFLESIDYNLDLSAPGKDRLTDDGAVPENQKGIIQGAFLSQVYINLMDGVVLLQELSPGMSRNCNILANKIREKLETEHYDCEKKLYTDLPFDNKQTSWHANFWAIKALKIPQKDAKELLKRTDQSTKILPVIGGQKMYQCETLFEVGWAEKAFTEIKTYWGSQMKAGATTFWEKVDNPISENLWHPSLRSRCHGWSAGPAYLFPRYILGVKPKEDWNYVIIQPVEKFIHWAEGIVPTPKGNIKVKWEKGKIAIISLPQNIQGEWIYAGMNKKLEGGRTHEIQMSS